MNRKKIRQAQVAAIYDKNLTPGAVRLFLILTDILIQTKEKEFPLPWKKVAQIMGIKNKKTAYSLLEQLAGKYLIQHPLKGSPPLRWYSLKNVL